MLSGSCMNPRTAGVSAALGFTLLQGILLTDDVLITCRQCQRPPLECVRCLRPSLQSQGTTTHSRLRLSLSAPHAGRRSMSLCGNGSHPRPDAKSLQAADSGRV